jgi:hypothetical protein
LGVRFGKNMKKDIESFLDDHNYGHDPELAEKLAEHLIEEKQYINREDARDEMLRIMRPVFRSKIDSVGHMNGSEEYLEGYSEGLREGLKIFQDMAE